MPGITFRTMESSVTIYDGIWGNQISYDTNSDLTISYYNKHILRNQSERNIDYS